MMVQCQTMNRGGNQYTKDLYKPFNKSIGGSNNESFLLENNIL